MIGPLGGTTVAARTPEACGLLGPAVAESGYRPRHIVGREEVTDAFWLSYQPHAPDLVWTRREPVYVLERGELVLPTKPARLRIERARERDVDEVVSNSAEQHIEDLGDDRRAMDPTGFFDRHRKDVLDGRWWVIRDAGRISFQVHVGAENAATVQLGGVMTPPSLRNQGHAMRGMAAICKQLLKRKPAVSLFCDEDNTAARRVYERAGFRHRFQNRSWLLDEEFGPCGDNYL